MRQLQILVSLLGALIVLRSCRNGNEDGRVSVSGTVILNGESVPFGKVLFTPVDRNNGLAGGGDIVDGRFQIPAHTGPGPGHYRVVISVSGRPNKQSLGDEKATELGPFGGTRKYEFDRVIDEGQRNARFSFQLSDIAQLKTDQ